MSSSARLLAAALACTATLAACGGQPSAGPSTGSGAAGADPTAGDQDSPPTTAAAATRIADDFPLSAGMGGPGDTVPTTRTGTGLRSFELCGTSPLRGLGTRDRMVADNSGGESLATRELVLLGSPDESARVAASFTDLATGCDRPTTGSGVETTAEARESTFGEAPATVVVQGYLFDGEPGPGHLVVHVVPVGAALLVTQTYGEWPDVSDGVDGTAQQLQDVVAAMDVFTEGGEPAVAQTEEIPDDFPMLAGWPPSSEADGDGRSGPSRVADAVVFTACGTEWREPARVDRVRAGWDSAEDYRTRQLTTYDDDDAAVAAVEDLVAFERSCPTEPPGEDGFGTEREVRPVALGDDGWAILERDTFNGSPSVFGASTVVVRVGRAVLVVSHGGHAGYPGGDGQQQVDAMGSEAARSIAQMCQFTKTGC